jgi:flagellar biosynthesis protein FlhG
MSDQAAALRAFARRNQPSAHVTSPPVVRVEVPPPVVQPRLAKAVAIASGKGGVGKSNIAANLAAALSEESRRVVLFDADMGCANADLLCGLSPKATLEDVLRGRCRLADVMLRGPGGFRLIPGASGVAHLASLNHAQRAAIFAQLSALDRVVDLMLIDLGAGLGSDTIAFASAADTVLIVCTPEPTSITDAYGAIKAITRAAPETDLRLVVNMVANDAEGTAVHRRIQRVAHEHLGVDVALAGSVPFDFAVRKAVKKRQLVLADAPRSRAARAIRTIGRGFNDLLPNDEKSSQRGGFLQRLLRSH